MPLNVHSLEITYLKSACNNVDIVWNCLCISRACTYKYVQIYVNISVANKYMSVFALADMWNWHVGNVISKCNHIWPNGNHLDWLVSLRISSFPLHISMEQLHNQRVTASSAVTATHRNTHTNTQPNCTYISIKTGRWQFEHLLVAAQRKLQLTLAKSDSSINLCRNPTNWGSRKTTAVGRWHADDGQVRKALMITAIKAKRSDKPQQSSQNTQPKENDKLSGRTDEAEKPTNIFCLAGVVQTSTPKANLYTYLYLCMYT